MSRLRFAVVVTAFAAVVAGIGVNTAVAEAILVEFSSAHCAPCQAMRPVTAQLEQAGVPVRHVDVNAEPHLAQRYGIRQTPTFVVVSGGKEVTRLSGVHSVAELQAALATNPGGPLVATGAVAKSFSGIPAPRTRLAPVPGSMPGPNVMPAQASVSASNQASVAGQGASPRGEPMPSLSVAKAVERAKAATVRLRVHDGHGHGVGTGTIIDTHGEEALVMTCGHLFRETKGEGRIEVDLFVGGQARTVAGQVIDYDAGDRDIALVAIRPGFPVQPVQVVAAGSTVQTGQVAFSFGCDRGADPSRRDTRITGVDKYNQHLGMSNLEIDGAPIDGRSGGGLFDQSGRLIGVCNAADYKSDIGIYTGPGSIHWQLDRVDLANLYQQPASTQLAESDQLPGPNQLAQSSPPAGDRLAALQRAGASVPASGASVRLEAAANASPGQPAEVAAGGDQEVIVIIRDRNQPGNGSTVRTLDRPSPELMRMIESQARR